MTRFLREPLSVRNAVSVIVTATALVVVIAGVVIRIVDHEEYPNIWKGMWLALQTATTVGYGDVVPQEFWGRVVAAIVMFQGVAFLAIITAAITSTFVARSEREQQERDVAAGKMTPQERLMEERFDDVTERLERLEEMLSRLAKS
jgi:voltage-gated potassium channel